jgi:hypothetical protein
MNDVLSILTGLLGLGFAFAPFLAVGAVCAVVTSRRNERKIADGRPAGNTPLTSFILGTLAAFGVAVILIGAACAVIITSYNSGG